MDGFMGKDAGGGSNDPFSRFWMDLISKMSTAGFTPPPTNSQDDGFKKMRQAFFDSWAKYCDEYMHSPAFLDMMKKSMDGALAFKQELNEFLNKALHDNQMPARSDTDSILLVLRSLEERVLERLDKLTQRVGKLEGTADDGPVESSPKRRPKGATR